MLQQFNNYLKVSQPPLSHHCAENWNCSHEQLCFVSASKIGGPRGKTGKGRGREGEGGVGETEGEAVPEVETQTFFAHFVHPAPREEERGDSREGVGEEGEQEEGLLSA